MFALWKHRSHGSVASKSIPSESEVARTDRWESEGRPENAGVRGKDLEGRLSVVKCMSLAYPTLSFFVLSFFLRHSDYIYSLRQSCNHALRSRISPSLLEWPIPG